MADEEKQEVQTETATVEKKADASKLSGNAKKVVDMVGEMSVLELAELVKVMEDKFGVSAAAPVAMMAAGGAGAANAPAAEEKSEFNINVTSAGSNKIGVIKAIREVTTLGLKEAKDMTDALPKVIKEGVKKAEAEEIKKKLEEAGATVELQ
ncbi:50S ribosomal protein L7/L12 [Patescibacteria group bacterium]|nr:50S ribosomal protein L7/L12 [Patescibacteria group bacterium]